MIICRTIDDLRTQLKPYRMDETEIGLVPTMGYLHEGHASLLRAAKQECAIVVLSIFVNPLQFGPNEDLERYPRDENRDLAVADQCNTDFVFIPSVQEMYPDPPLTNLKVDALSQVLCGKSRVGHFDGVGVVVSKLFNIVKPDRAYFGMKDAQQVAIVEQMVKDLNMDIAIIRCHIVREPDGLALSSRNVYLSAEARQQAVILSKTLEQAESWLEQNELTIEEFIDKVKQNIKQMDQANIDYVEFVHYPSLKSLAIGSKIINLQGEYILALAVKFGSTRLIDNRLYGIGGN